MRLAFLALLLLPFPITRVVAAQGLTIVAPAAPGGGWDQLARAMQRALEAEGLARSVQVENIPGAAGTIGLSRFVSGRAGDSRALLVTGLVMVGGIAQNASPVRLEATTPIARLVGEYEAIAVPSSSPLRSLGDVLDALVRDPGAVSWGGGSAGGTDQMLVDLLARARGIDPRRTSYVAFAGGGEARAALLGSQVSVGVSGVGEFAELASSGLVRILAVSSPQRIPGIDAPTLQEAGVDLTLANWRGVVAPPGLPRADRQRLEDMVLAMTRSATWRAERERRGWDDLMLGGEGFERFIAAEVHRVDVLAAARRGVEVAAAPWTVQLPWVLLALLLVALGLGVRGGRAASSGDGAATTSGTAGTVEAVGVPRPRHWRPVALILGAMVANLLIAERLGFVVGATLLFLATAVAFGERLGRRVVLMALGFTVGTFSLFRGVLGVLLPIGEWWGGS
jgi:putative tricarboxylic transport membrane protein